MFTVKVVKKHGVPSGTPEVLAYIDPDTPGEPGTNKLYMHTILLTRGIHILFSNDPTPLTDSTFAKWLFDNGFKSSTAAKRTEMSTFEYFSTDTLNMLKNVHHFSSNGTSITARYSITAVKVDNGALSGTTTTIQTGSDSVNADTVQEIII